jgi:PTS system nitrogen regulatory IIA component
MKVVDFLRSDCVLPSLRGRNKNDVLNELATHLASIRPGIDAQVLGRALAERELLASTAIGDGIAIPHGRLESVDNLIGVLGRSVEGLDFESIDGKPTHLIFMLVAPSAATGTHLKALARLSRLFRDGLFRKHLLDAPDSVAMFQTIQEEDAKY